MSDLAHAQVYVECPGNNCGAFVPIWITSLGINKTYATAPLRCRQCSWIFTPPQADDMESKALAIYKEEQEQ